MSRAAERLKLVGSQDALILLRAAFGSQRVQHLLRCSPSVDHVALNKFDVIQRNALTVVTNSNFSDFQWLQASLPIKEGDLGLRRVSALALPAFLSSAVSTSTLQDTLLVRCSSPPDPFKAQLLAAWGSLFGDFPVGSAACKQSAWDSPGFKSDKSLILSGLQTPRERAVFLASSFPHSGAWLTALPIAACGLRLDDEAVRVGVALRLGLHLYVTHECPCGAMVDTWGSHAMVCKRAPARISRHHAVNDVIAHALTSAGVRSTSILRSSCLRPD